MYDLIKDMLCDETINTLCCRQSPWAKVLFVVIPHAGMRIEIVAGAIYRFLLESCLEGNSPWILYAGRCAYGVWS